MAVGDPSSTPDSLTGPSWPNMSKRQDAIMPIGTGTESTGSGSGNGSSASGEDRGSLSLAIVIPVSIIVGLLLLVAIVWVFRRKLFPFLARRHTDGTSNGSLTAEELAAGSTRSRRTTTSNLQNATANGGTGTAAAGNIRGRNRRYVRRTESGRSIRTLPEYSKEAGDEELVLSGEDIAEEELFDDDVPNTPTIRMDTLPSTERDASPLGLEQVPTPTPPPRASSLHSPSEAELETPGPTGPTSAPLDGHIRTSSIGRRGWGEAPTYLEAMSSPSLPDPSSLEAGVPPPRTQTLKDRTSNSFRGLLTRAGKTFAPRLPSSPLMAQRTDRYSSTSLLLQPQTSRASQYSMPRHGSSPYDSPWQSTYSLHHISSPVPNSAIRASFDTSTMPRAGLSGDQMRFLSSSEAVNLFGVQLDPPPGRRRRSVGTILDSRRGSFVIEEGGEPPSWEELHRREESIGSRSEEGSPEPERPDGQQAVRSEGSRSAMRLTDEPVTHANSHRALTIDPPASGLPLPDTPGLQIEPPTPISPSHPDRPGATTT